MDKAISLISGGIDSPVATYIMMEKGLEVDCIHFDNQPFTDSRSKEKTIKQVKNIANKLNRKIRLYIIDHGRNLAAFKQLNGRYTCLFCKRMMLRVAEKVARKEGAKFLITGENLGQVASQTLDNMVVTDSSVNLLILRPILMNDKQETIDYAKRIGTFDISIEKSACCYAVPQKPVTKAKKDIAQAEEEKIDINALIEDSVKTAEVIVIEP